MSSQIYEVQIIQGWVLVRRNIPVLIFKISKRDKWINKTIHDKGGVLGCKI